MWVILYYLHPVHLFAHEGVTRGRPEELAVVKVAEVVWDVDTFHSSCGANVRAVYLNHVESGRNPCTG